MKKVKKRTNGHLIQVELEQLKQVVPLLVEQEDLLLQLEANSIEDFEKNINALTGFTNATVSANAFGKEAEYKRLLQLEMLIDCRLSSKDLTKSKRGELEIVDLINIYIKKSSVKFEEIGRGISWLDMGSFEDLNDCSNYIRAIEKRQNFMISSPEEIAFLNNWITKKKLLQISNKYNNDYGDYLKKLCL
jgi:hypothetical protein